MLLITKLHCVINFVAKCAVFELFLGGNEPVLGFPRLKEGFLASEAFTKMLESSMEEEV